MTYNRKEDKNRIHRITSNDGTEIAGRVHGQGPPLVFLQGGIGDGDLDWQAMLPHLTDRFTCHLPSMRGRGLSGDHPDLSFGQLVDDVIAYIDSIREPSGLVGWSLGAGLAFCAAARSDAVNAVAPFEHAMMTLTDEQEKAAFNATVARMGELAAEGRFTDALRAFAYLPFSDEEMAEVEDTGYFEAAGRYAPNLLSFFQQQMGYQGPMPDDPAVLSAISAPVLVLHGSDATPLMTRSVRHVADHVPNATVQQIPGAGHAAPLTHPEALAEALIEFFSQPSSQPDFH